MSEVNTAAVPEGAKRAEELRVRWAWVEPSVWTDRMLTALEDGVKGDKWFSLIDKLYRRENLEAAWKEVAVNKGSAGVDHETVEQFRWHAQEELARISEALRSGKY